MEKRWQTVLHWAPRILGILFAIFVSIFALDVFGQDQAFWQTVVALIMHLVPTYIVVLLLLLSWRQEFIGGVNFVALSALYLLLFRGQHILTYILISGPAFLIGALFIWNSYLPVPKKPSEPKKLSVPKKLPVPKKGKKKK
ncbi:hypothetical protein KY349_05560 [Candidatus Woesearchaeota archaeon]|jgi:hypothetical protein|nr:hypothetical protein [Candidatus Woesearchaeota archaeon]